MNEDAMNELVELVAVEFGPHHGYALAHARRFIARLESAGYEIVPAPMTEQEN